MTSVPAAASGDGRPRGRRLRFRRVRALSNRTPLRVKLVASVLLLTTVGLFVAGEVQVVDRHVDLGHHQPRDPLDPTRHVLTNLLRQLRDRLAVLNHDRQINRRLLLTDLDRHTLRALIADPDPLRQRTDRPRSATTQLIHPTNLTRRDTRNLRDHRISDRRRALLGLENSRRLTATRQRATRRTL